MRILLILPFILFGCSDPVPAEKLEHPKSIEYPKSIDEYIEKRDKRREAREANPDKKLIEKLAHDYIEKETDWHFTYYLEDIQKGWARVHVETISKRHKSRTYAVFLKEIDKSWKVELMISTSSGDYGDYLDAMIEDDKFPCFMVRGFMDCELFDKYKRLRKEGKIGKRPRDSDEQ